MLNGFLSPSLKHRPESRITQALATYGSLGAAIDLRP